jgi:hypothetical protein
MKYLILLIVLQPLEELLVVQAAKEAHITNGDFYSMQIVAMAEMVEMDLVYF